MPYYRFYKFYSFPRLTSFMTGLKIGYIGAGSFRFSIGLFRNIVAARELFPFEACLHDIDERSLDIMTRILTRMVKKAGANVKVTSTTDRRACLENADFLYKSISVGMQESEWFDIHVPQKFGIPQNTGDTCGPGGLFRGLRCVPQVQAIARDMKELCPKATLLNYTNPQATIVMGARRVSKDLQYVGLCHELFGGMGSVRKALVSKGVDVPRWQDLDIRYGGVNHFTWLTSIEKDGTDLYPVLRDNAAVFQASAGRPFNWFLLQQHGYFPIPGSRHVAEFMPEYYNNFNHELKPFGITKLRDVALLDKARRGAYWIFRRMAGRFPVPGPTSRGEKAIDMTVDWLESNPVHHVVNLPNDGLVPNLPEGAIIEVPGYFKDRCMHGVSLGPMPAGVAALVKPHAEQQFLTVDAAEGNSPELVIKAALHDPMCKFVGDDDRVEDMVWSMLHFEKAWLPAEWAEWIPSLDDLKRRKRFVEPRELASKKVARQVKYPVDPAVRSKAWFPAP